MSHPSLSSVLRYGLLVALGASLLVGCASPSHPRQERSIPSTPRPPVTELAVYPARGQDEREVRRDRFECHAWAVRQSGFDPATMSQRAPTPVPRVEPDPPSGYGTATGAVTGAVLGAVVSNPRHAGEGAAVGAVIGAVAGTASDASREARAERIEDAYAAQAARRDNPYSDETNRYRRALGACLEARGYSVR